MKQYVAILTLACASLLAGAAALRAQDATGDDTAKKLVGTWRMVSQKTGDAAEYTDFPKEKVRLKNLVPGGCAWVEYEAETGKVSTFVAGTWSAQGTEYREKAAVGMGGAYDFLKDKDPKFECKLDGNKWNHTGQIDNWKGDENWERQVAAQESEDKELAGKLVGAWRLVAASEPGGEEAKEIPKEQQTCLAYITPTHWMFVQYEADTKKATQCGGGTWSARAGESRMKADFALGETMEPLRGKEMVWTPKVDGDKLAIAGAMGDAKMQLVWERIKEEAK